MYRYIEHSQMNKLVAPLYITFANVLMLGQTLSPGEATAPATTPRVDRVKQLSKRFPVELIVPIPPSGKAALSRSYCVQPSLVAKSLSVKPCRTDSRKLRLVPAFENIVPPAKPAKP